MSETSLPRSYGGLRVLIAGGGVAGLEAMLALRELAGDLVDIELLAPEPAFWYKPLAVAEPFDAGQVHHFELAGIAEVADATFTLGQLASVDDDSRIARTSHGAEIRYDALVVACGVLSQPAIAGALTFRGPADSDAFRHLLEDAENGRVRSIAFAIPDTAAWPLPLYELALLTARRLERGPNDVALTPCHPGARPALALWRGSNRGTPHAAPRKRNQAPRRLPSGSLRVGKAGADPRGDPSRRAGGRAPAA